MSQVVHPSAATTYTGTKTASVQAPSDVPLPGTNTQASRRGRASQASHLVAEPMEIEGTTEVLSPEQASPAVAGPIIEEGGPIMDGFGSPDCESCGVGDGYGEPYWGGGDFYGGSVPWWGFIPGRLWVQADALNWWTRGTILPPLVTTSPRSVGSGSAGELGPNSTILFGEEKVNNDGRFGGRITFGLRPNECAPWGAEVSYMGLEEESASFARTSEGTPILARPFFNVGVGQNGQRLSEADALIIAFPNLRTGSISAEASTDFQGVEVLLRRRLSDWCTGQFDLIGGWRFNRLDDELLIASSFEQIGQDTIIPVGTIVDVTDSFEAENIFTGAEIGFNAHFQRCRWSLDLLMKVAMGNTESEVTVAGSTMRTLDEETSTEEYGFLALPSNIGVYRKNDFAMIPEVGVTFGYDLTCHLRATFGYTLIYWGKVARAAEQVDLDLNLPNTQDVQVGLPRPEFPFATNDFWATGMNFGLEYRF